MRGSTATATSDHAQGTEGKLCRTPIPAAKGTEPFEPWKVPFENEQEWFLFVKGMLEGLRETPEAAKIFDSMLETLGRHREKEGRR